MIRQSSPQDSTITSLAIRYIRGDGSDERKSELRILLSGLKNAERTLEIVYQYCAIPQDQINSLESWGAYQVDEISDQDVIRRITALERDIKDHVYDLAEAYRQVGLCEQLISSKMQEWRIVKFEREDRVEENAENIMKLRRDCTKLEEEAVSLKSEIEEYKKNERKADREARREA